MNINIIKLNKNIIYISNTEYLLNCKEVLPWNWLKLIWNWVKVLLPKSKLIGGKINAKNILALLLTSFDLKGKPMKYIIK